MRGGCGGNGEMLDWARGRAGEEEKMSGSGKPPFNSLDNRDEERSN